MRYILQLIAGILLNISVPAQTVDQALNAGNTYAIIIGISKYNDPEIKSLEYAHRDAKEFYNFLKSQSGGSVPEKNIRLLLDSAATFGEMYSAMKWVSDESKENDRVYFYFSGHGEIENRNIHKNGYLLLHKTTAVAFAGSGFSIDLLNDEITNLSVNNKAKVIVITDACHSGKMNDKNFKGDFFVGEQLMLKQENEVRIASCKPDQLSNESENWGGGRGVFSYHLLNGLQGGLADKDDNKVVTVRELKDYLEDEMKKDKWLLNMDSVQTPVINYKVNYNLASVIEDEVVKIQMQKKSDSVKISREIVPDIPISEDESIEPDEFFKHLLEKQNLQTLTDSLRLNLLSDTAIVFAIIDHFKKDSLSKKARQKLSSLENELRTDKEKLNRLNQDISILFQSLAEEVRSNYIKGDQADHVSGDEAELERRRYYKSVFDDYDVYVRMLEVMLELSKYDRYLNERAATFLHYFKGFVLRIKIPFTTLNKDSLIELALAEQNKALALEVNDALIYNELGVLYQYKNNLIEAEKNYVRATELSPAWAIPYSNLSRLFYNINDDQKALMYADTADNLQKGLHPVSITRALIYEKQGNLLLAEENYHNAIDINPRYYLPFERLGFVNMNMANYAVADSFFFETSIRKVGHSFLPAEPRVYSDKSAMSINSNIGCPFKDTIKFKPYDMLALFAWGVAELFETATEGINENGIAPVVKKNNRGAIRHFMQVIAIDKKNPLVYHYLARVYYEQQQWEEAELMFRYAIANYMSEKTFKKYLDSIKMSNAYPYDHSCYENLFSGYYYNQADDFYFLASLYEKWGKTYKAEACFRKVIELFPREFRAYMKLWQKLEKQKLFTEAEMVLLNCEKYYQDTIYNELNSFYRRAIYNEPGKADWYYKLGLLLYNNTWRPLKAESVDNIRWYPRINQELFPNEIFFTSSINDSGQIVYKSTNRKWEDSFIDIGQGTSEKNQTELISSSSFTTTKFTGAIELEELKLASQVEYPKFEGILYLTKAAELISDRETRSSIYFKIGEMYIMAGSKKRAIPEFERSLTLLPDNVNIIIKLAEVYAGLHKNRLAIDQLDYLYKSNQISFDKRLQLARFNILAGNQASAERLLNKADSIHPYILPEIYNLNGLSNMLANKPVEAISAYEKSITAQQADPWFNHYSIARIYAKKGNTNQAWKYLTRAVELGFNYSYVLQNDGYMESLRKSSKWQTMISGINMKKYKTETPAN